MDREGFFAVRDIVDFCFCPRTIYFRYCIRAGKETTPKMVRGQKFHESFRARRTRLVGDMPGLPRMSGVRLYSRKYGFSTVVDAILVDGDKAYPVEFKASERPRVMYDTHRYQVVAQAMAIEEVMKKRVPKGYVRYADGSVVEIEITTRVRERLMEILKRMEEVLKYERMPEATGSKRKCRDCFYRNLCRRL